MYVPSSSHSYPAPPLKLTPVIGCTFFFISVLSAPIKKTVCFANVRSEAGDKVVDFGLFGACWWAYRE